FGNEGQTVGFTEVTGELGEQFVRGDADAGGKSAFGKKLPLQRARQRHGMKERFIGIVWNNRAACSRCICFDSQGRRPTYCLREVEISFINRNLLDERAGLRDNGHDGPRFLPVMVHAWPDETSFRTKR